MSTMYAIHYDDVCTSHQILLEKLEHYGIRGQANDLLTSYLAHRKQYVTDNYITSTTKCIAYGQRWRKHF